jgi:hypothetical protein
MSATREFKCPDCKRTLYKSDAMMVLSEVHQSGGSYMAFGSVDSIPCPACGRSMGVQDVIAGRYDRKPGPLSVIAVLVVLGVAGFFVLKSCAGG